MSLRVDTLLWVGRRGSFLDGPATVLSTVEAKGARQAFRQLGLHHDVWVVVTDYRLSDAGGVELVRRVRTSSPTTLGIVLVEPGDFAEAALDVRGGEVFRFVRVDDAAGIEVAIEAAVTAAIAARCAGVGFDEGAARQATILAMAHLAERRDQETGRHLQRVAALTRLVAEGMRADEVGAEFLDQRFIEDVTIAAPLHDLGKIAVPDAILNKEGPLDEDEWKIMRQHATVGAETIEAMMLDGNDLSFLPVARDVARAHHERWDGTGYPAGLAGSAIPLSARIVAIADCYDALRSARAYKRAWTHAEAIAWIRNQRGRHFDPEVTDVLLARAEQANEIQSRLADAVRSAA
ncbi:MAG: HD domain-containing phosphohydrolase [Planctomycetota bacterium]